MVTSNQSFLHVMIKLGSHGFTDLSLYLLYRLNSVNFLLHCCSPVVAIRFIIKVCLCSLISALWIFVVSGALLTVSLKYSYT